MKLHLDKEKFQEFADLTADVIGISPENVIRDYYIVELLENLAKSEYADECVFKGGTSLSKCYPKSIERFSEDIDLTYIPNEERTKKQYDRGLKAIEKLIANNYKLIKSEDERNDRNKSSNIIFDQDGTKIKLEIGSSVKPEPYSKKVVKSYIQEFLEEHNAENEILEYELNSVEINVLNIERTFIDKLMSVKRHAICGSLPQKVRHIYDVYRLFNIKEIKEFIENKEELKRIVQLTKNTDTQYLEKRDVPQDYCPKGQYDFNSWKDCFSATIRSEYESLHIKLLYTDVKQNFDDAFNVFLEMDNIFIEIEE